MKFGLALPGKRRCESVGMAPTHGVYALRHALFSLLVCQAYSPTPRRRAQARVLSPQSSVSQDHPAPCCVDRRKAYTTV